MTAGKHLDDLVVQQGTRQVDTKNFQQRGNSSSHLCVHSGNYIRTAGMLS
jgi:hypothetical protein